MADDKTYWEAKDTKIDWGMCFNNAVIMVGSKGSVEDVFKLTTELYGKMLYHRAKDTGLPMPKFKGAGASDEYRQLMDNYNKSLLNSNDKK